MPKKRRRGSNRTSASSADAENHDDSPEFGWQQNQAGEQQPRHQQYRHRRVNLFARNAGILSGNRDLETRNSRSGVGGTTAGGFSDPSSVSTSWRSSRVGEVQAADSADIVEPPPELEGVWEENWGGDARGEDRLEGGEGRPEGGDKEEGGDEEGGNDDEAMESRWWYGVS